MSIKVEVSVGELLDKITILRIKSERIADPDKLVNVRRELEVLESCWEENRPAGVDLEPRIDALKAINERLWEIEDAIREKEAMGQFDQEFIELARAVYFSNDRRAAIKREINELSGSGLVEEKSYRDYAAGGG
ncbi:MAG: hypothetical protein D6786_05150 [Gammaproteobacteria bacterium]|nr:MAG: hypothetical protein D6786_05150 [Gammaproteobacteria bacterium]